MLVNDWMTRTPITIPSDTPLLEAQRLLREHGFRRLPVVDQGKLVGIVTDRDLKEASASDATSLSIFELNYLLSRLTVRDVMSAPVQTVKANDRIEKAALLMLDYKISGLPVVEFGRVVGILTITDLLRAFVEVLELRQGKLVLGGE